MNFREMNLAVFAGEKIPHVFFLEHHSQDQLQECVERIVEYFHPRLALGISDELPQGGNEESLDRVGWIADYCRRSRQEA